jgi:hypothetical protein
MVGSNCTINMSVSSQLNLNSNLKVQNKRERKEIENKKEIGKHTWAQTGYTTHLPSYARAAKLPSPLTLSL